MPTHILYHTLHLFTHRMADIPFLYSMLSITLLKKSEKKQTKEKLAGVILMEPNWDQIFCHRNKNVPKKWLPK